MPSTATIGPGVAPTRFPGLVYLALSLSLAIDGALIPAVALALYLILALAVTVAVH